ncbi:hypothetical protein N7445_004170 [Penicillium cf. griseofulvum]|nr:hypothetical protein N7445_004170 [Penicillium cf. griseofulvum]
MAMPGGFRASSWEIKMMSSTRDRFETRFLSTSRVQSEAAEANEMIKRRLAFIHSFKLRPEVSVRQ